MTQIGKGGPRAEHISMGGPHMHNFAGGLSEAERDRIAQGGHRHLTCLRKPVEPRVLQDLRRLHNHSQIPDADWQVAELPQVETSRARPWVPAHSVPKPSQEGVARTALGQDVEKLRAQVAELQATRLGEELCGALSRSNET